MFFKYSIIFRTPYDTSGLFTIEPHLVDLIYNLEIIYSKVRGKFLNRHFAYIFYNEAFFLCSPVFSFQYISSLA